MNKPKETVLEINLAHLTHNYTYIKSKLDPSVKILAVVKAAGYGSDAISIAKHLEKIGTDYFAVAYVSEGVALRKAGVKTPILVLHPQPVNFEELIKYNLEPSIYSVRILTEFIKVAEVQKQIEYPIHIKFNTGLNRLGVIKDDINSITSTISTTKTIKVTSIFSHLAASEDLDEKDFTNTQIASFQAITDNMIANLAYTPMLHQCNTSGVFNYPSAHFDMVRTGIGLYGYGNDTTYDKELIPIASLKSIISQIHTLENGDTLGYNRAFVATKSTKTATIPIGHADGISRIYGNGNGFVTIAGKQAFILGNVCMDMIMVDITNIDCNEGDEVIIFGNSSSATILAENAGTISYELLTAISPRVKRKIIDNM